MNDILVTSGVRIDLAGPWTDEPPFSIECGGAVVNVGINLSNSKKNGDYTVSVYLQKISNPLILIKSVDLDCMEKIKDSKKLFHLSGPLKLLKGAIIASGIIPDKNLLIDQARSDNIQVGFKLITESFVPKGSGLGSSGALSTCILAALYQFQNIKISKLELCQRAFEFESNFLGGGWQDQFGSAFGGINFIYSQPGKIQKPTIEKLVLSRGFIAELQNRILLAYTGESHIAGTLADKIFEDFKKKKREKMLILNKLKDLAFEAKRALLKQNLEILGRIIANHWSYEKLLGTGISNKKIDGYFEAIEKYIEGGRLGGAGGGGFMILIARKDTVELLEKKLINLLGSDSVYRFKISDGIRIKNF